MPTIRVALTRDVDSILKNVLAQVGDDGALRLVQEDSERILIAYYPQDTYRYFEALEAKVEGEGSDDSAAGFDWLDNRVVPQ